MELTQIKYFLETAATEHITKSAEKLHISQPALTKAIQNLEGELGVTLFARRGRNIVLTPQGEYLRERLVPIVDSLDNLASEMSGMTEAENYNLRINVSAASTLVTGAIIEYKKLNPPVNFHLLQNNDKELFDVEVKTGMLGSLKKGSNSKVFTEQIYLAVPADGRFSGRDTVYLSEVRDEGFISLFGSKQLRNICDRFCMMAGFTPNVIFESDSPDAVKNMIGSSIGIGFWPEFTWGEIDSDHVRLLRIIEPDCRRNIEISFNPIKRDGTCAADFYRFLVDYFAKKTGTR